MNLLKYTTPSIALNIYMTYYFLSQRSEVYFRILDRILFSHHRSVTFKGEFSGEAMTLPFIVWVLPELIQGQQNGVIPTERKRLSCP